MKLAAVKKVSENYYEVGNIKYGIFSVSKIEPVGACRGNNKAIMGTKSLSQTAARRKLINWLTQKLRFMSAGYMTAIRLETGFMNIVRL